ncbi:IPT/TIG domain-containing protein [Entamoeba marina]
MEEYTALSYFMKLLIQNNDVTELHLNQCIESLQLVKSKRNDVDVLNEMVEHFEIPTKEVEKILIDNIILAFNGFKTTTVLTTINEIEDYEDLLSKTDKTSTIIPSIISISNTSIPVTGALITLELNVDKYIKILINDKRVSFTSNGYNLYVNIPPMSNDQYNIDFLLLYQDNKVDFPEQLFYSSSQEPEQLNENFNQQDVIIENNIENTGSVNDMKEPSDNKMKHFELEMIEEPLITESSSLDSSSLDSSSEELSEESIKDVPFDNQNNKVISSNGKFIDNSSGINQRKTLPIDILTQNLSIETNNSPNNLMPRKYQSFNTFDIENFNQIGFNTKHDSPRAINGENNSNESNDNEIGDTEQQKQENNYIKEEKQENGIPEKEEQENNILEEEKQVPILSPPIEIEEEELEEIKIKQTTEEKQETTNTPKKHKSIFRRTMASGSNKKGKKKVNKKSNLTQSDANPVLKATITTTEGFADVVGGMNSSIHFNTIEPTSYYVGESGLFKLTGDGFGLYPIVYIGEKLVEAYEEISDNVIVGYLPYYRKPNTLDVIIENEFGNREVQENKISVLELKD